MKQSKTRKVQKRPKTKTMKIKHSGKTHTIRWRTDKDLDKYDNVVLFPKKVEQANKILEKAKFPPPETR